jgi:hypothetical protein
MILHTEFNLTKLSATPRTTHHHEPKSGRRDRRERRQLHQGEFRRHPRGDPIHLRAEGSTLVTSQPQPAQMLEEKED